MIPSQLTLLVQRTRRGNTCVYFLKGIFAPLRARLLSHCPAEIAIPSLVKAELLFGAYKSERRIENEQAISQFLLPFAVVPFPLCQDSCRVAEGSNTPG